MINKMQQKLSILEIKQKHFLITEKTKCRNCGKIKTLRYYGKNIKYSYICTYCGYINDMKSIFE